jgi:hypothetical protein
MTALWTGIGRRREGAAESVRCSSSIAVSRSSVVLRAVVLVLAALCALWAMAGRAGAVTLPNGRAYEQVSPAAKNGVDPGFVAASSTGNLIDWEGIGGCCGASTASVELYQAARSASGWETTAATPNPKVPLEGLLQEQAPMWMSPDLSQTIYWTSATYPGGANRTPGPGSTNYNDLYLQGPTGTPTWLSQGPGVTGESPAPGTGPYNATLAAATPDAKTVLFNTAEQLTPDATGLADLNTPPEYLYARTPAAPGKTTLVDVTNTTLSAPASIGDTTLTVNSTTAFAQGQPITIGNVLTGGADVETDTVAGVTPPNQITLNTALVNAHASGESVEALISPDGAIAGNGNWLDQPWTPADLFGTTTNAISSDGTKVFFESPPTFAGGGGGAEGVGVAHLYMRDLSNDTTTPIDNPSDSASGAQYEGASQDGSLAFFTSSEGLGGNTNTDNELYEFNTATKSVVPLSEGNTGTADGDVLGVTAISNDGSHVYFVAEGMLAANKNAAGASATSGDPNLYVYNTTAPAASATTFIATLSQWDVQSCIPNCVTNGSGAVLTSEPDLDRPAVPTADGTVLAFDSNAQLTTYPDGKPQNPAGPATTLTTTANSGDTSITVASTKGLEQYHFVYVQDGTISQELAIASIPNTTTLDLRSPVNGTLTAGDTVTQLAPFQIYRYSTTDGSLTCISCDPEGGTSIGSSSFGDSAGGTYAPAGQAVAMNSTGSQIFFDTPDPLVKGDTNTGAFPGGFGSLTLSRDVYEWEQGSSASSGCNATEDATKAIVGQDCLVSDGTTSTGAILGGTTPSGNDVFFNTLAQLVPQDTDAYDDIYDARVDGGFPAPPAPGPVCGDPESCRTGVSPTEFFPIPGSATLIAPNVAQPTFTVSGISNRQRNQLIKTGKVTLTVTATASGKIVATVFGKIHGLQTQVASGHKSFSGAGGGKGKITLRLARAARRALNKKHKLALTISVSYSQSTQTDVATLTLNKKPKKKHTTRARPASIRARRVKGA